MGAHQLVALVRYTRHVTARETNEDARRPLVIFARAMLFSFGHYLKMLPVAARHVGAIIGPGRAWGSTMDIRPDSDHALRTFLNQRLVGLYGGRGWVVVFCEGAHHPDVGRPSVFVELSGLLYRPRRTVIL